MLGFPEDALIAIVDCGIGNTGSIANMLRKCGAEGVVTSAAEDVARADKVILPGVGAFGPGMERLRASGLVPVLERQVLERKVPLLGICLGMQLLSERSEEGGEAGLGWLEAETVRFRNGAGEAPLKVPHMGWNTVQASRPAYESLTHSARFYFVHSYHVVCRRPADVLATTSYGGEFVSAVQKDNIVGVQFHPEKSHRHGLAFLREFSQS